MIRKLIPLLIALLLSSCTYHKPEYRGKVIDIETGAPIEGVVVAVIYTKTVYAVADTLTSFVKATEVLTDKNGIFVIPSYTTIIPPLTWDGDPTSFIFYKPGYGSYSTGGFYGECFTTTCNEEEFIGSTLHKPPLQYRIGTGYVALPKVKNKRQRLNATSMAGINLGPKKLPMLFKAINEDLKRNGYKPKY